MAAAALPGPARGAQRPPAVRLHAGTERPLPAQVGAAQQGLLRQHAGSDQARAGHPHRHLPRTRRSPQGQPRDPHRHRVPPGAGGIPAHARGA
ncbi:hypothetical protein G6F50_018463 [Rhizopus delemar]|uniref:Uncharacterized protein n=1 Tax=Rhizopus delemar TaxID=936053 RepID=A0A9P7BYV4_9FUNG|nr:hypothetical protein G6F50_018463 [Rhizopus delemar]